MRLAMRVLGINAIFHDPWVAVIVGVFRGETPGSNR
jgi:hypothetical protein